MSDAELLAALAARVDDLEARLETVVATLVYVRGEDDGPASRIVRMVVDLVLARAGLKYQAGEVDALVERACAVARTAARASLGTGGAP